MTVIDLGQTYNYRYTAVDEDDEPGDVGSVTYAITLPDNTSSTGSATDVGVGLYDIAYLTAQAGRHVLVGTATGGVLGSKVDIFTDVFEVVSSSAAGIVSVDEAMTHLRLSASADADLVRSFVLVASDVAEAYTGQVWRRTTVTAELHDGGGAYVGLLRTPVLSVTSASESGVSVAASGYVLDPTNGWLWRGTSTTSTPWATGRRSVSVTYVAGPAGGVVPPKVRFGTLELIRYLFESRRGAAGFPRQGGEFELVQVMGYSIPRRIAEMWDLDRLDGVA